MLERTDVAILPLTSVGVGVNMNANDGDNNNNNNKKEYVLHVLLRFFVYQNAAPATTAAAISSLDDTTLVPAIQEAAAATLARLVSERPRIVGAVLHHMATAVWQERLRAVLHHKYDAVAFVANGAVLPRQSGASVAPMASPPALPFLAPRLLQQNLSPVPQSVTVDMGVLCPYLVLPSVVLQGNHPGCVVDSVETTTVEATTTQITLPGLLIPRGITLICGGGYHGKSTLLRCLAAGVYNKIPGDGREFCVTVDDAVTVRAEDGRYVHRCNVSAFLANLPTTTTPTSTTSPTPATPTPVTTQCFFSTREASGSTSQAANVVEAIEMGASALLVDEDTSAANFMARDGRMRALVMDESITPLLYRVNGLYHTHGISSIVVVGGVGDWLDVPQHVLLMDRYVCHDATAKARSVSRQFAHGHVQYAGRGTVHRLDWPKSGTPVPRRPAMDERPSYNFHVTRTAVVLLDSGGGSSSNSALSLQQLDDSSMSRESSDDDNDDDDDDVDDDDDERCTDLSRCEQLMGKRPQLYGCGLGLAYLLQLARENPALGLPDLLRQMDCAMDAKGLLGLIVPDGVLDACNDNSSSNSDNNNHGYPQLSATWNVLVESMGCAYRPRRFEVGQALTRWRGMILESIPVEDDGVEARAQADAERQRQELLAIWHARRKPGSRWNQPPQAEDETLVTTVVADST